VRLNRFFDTIVSAEDVGAEKPSPEPYLLALERLELERGYAVVVEDTQSGVTSGTGAGLQVIAVRHEHNVDHDFSRAALTLESLVDTEGVLRAIRRLLDDDRGPG
jgi:beta-phosphoglucomutase-like phosphatase (HAD superfamily)